MHPVIIVQIQRIGKKFPKLPDGILEENNNYYFFDAKAKSSRNYIGKINFRDYKEYLKIKQIIKY